MPFTREFIRNLAKESGIEMPPEFENGLVSEHLSSRDAYAKTEVEKALKNNKPDEPKPVKETDEYKKLERDFNDYKAEQVKKETRAAKEKAAAAYFESKGITEENQKLALRACRAELDAAELDGDKFKDTKAFDDLIAGDLAGLVTTEERRGAEDKTPPPGNGGNSKNLEEMSMEEYIAARKKKG